MPKTKEETAVYMKKYYQENKERLKLYREENKERISAREKKYREENKEKCALKSKKYRDKNPKEHSKRKKMSRLKNLGQYRKREKIRDWIYNGLICEDVDSLYCHYVSETHCDFCRVKFGKIGDGSGTFKCMDHSHETGLFRNFLCNRCNIKRGE